MITIIHGEQTVSSREYFSQEKNAVDNPVSMEGKTVTVTDFVQALEGGSLFVEEKHIFLEDFLTRPASTETTAIISYLQQNPQHHIVFWEGKELGKKITGVFPHATVKVFAPAKEIFSFVDSLSPHNKKLIIQFHRMLKTEDVEFIFFMMIRQFRLLLSLSDAHVIDAIDEVKRLAPWQKGKLLKQASLFSKQQLIAHYQKLFAIDLAIKTGTNALNRVQSVDIFLLDL